MYSTFQRDFNVVVLVHSEVSLLLELFCGHFWYFLCIFCDHTTLFHSFSFVHCVFSRLAVLSSLPALLVLPALCSSGELCDLFFFFPLNIISINVFFLPSFLYRIAAVWLLHMRASAG